MKLYSIVSISLLMACLLHSNSASAKLRVGANMMFGLGGEATTEFEAGGRDIEIEDDFETTPGFSVYVESNPGSSAGNIMDRLGLGAEARFLFWETEGNAEGTAIEICPYAKMGFNAAQKVTIFGRFAPGLTIAIPDDDDIDTAFGFNIAMFGGVEYPITNQIGVLAELGFIYHLAFGELEALGYSADYTLSGAQFHINFGVFF